jgi:hypothetical protein
MLCVLNNVESQIHKNLVDTICLSRIQLCEIVNLKNKRTGTQRSAKKTLPKSEPDLVAVCGIYCGVCPVFGVKCPGCARDPRSKECALFSCSSSKKVKYCFQCSEFPCRIHYERGIYEASLGQLERCDEQRASNVITAFFQECP